MKKERLKHIQDKRAVTKRQKLDMTSRRKLGEKNQGCAFKSKVKKLVHCFKIFQMKKKYNSKYCCDVSLLNDIFISHLWFVNDGNVIQSGRIINVVN